ncbi:hypothetical protein UJ79_00525 [Salmonella enterica subsp. enterica serovar Muenchen]|nr:hypothetical protein [Salmonella enterica subsp. enterica serovar Muenchen]
MSSEPKIVSLTPAIAGWWAKFRQDIEWYSPVAAWALCEMQSNVLNANDGKYQAILPVLTGDEGMRLHHEEQGHCELLYLPDEKFTTLGGEYCYAWVLVDGVKKDGNTQA